MRHSYNLALFGHPGNGTLRDLTKVAALVAELHPDINAVAISCKQDLRGLGATLALAFRPTLAIELARPRLAPIGRGFRLRQLRVPRNQPGYSKIEELGRLAAASIPVPKWIEIKPDTKLDPEEWGPYVVVKPSVGGRGYNVVIRRTARARFKSPDNHDADSLGRLAPMIAQEFIYTGLRPESIRVLTFLGHPVGAIRYHGHSQPTELKERFGFKETGGHDIVAFDAGGRVDLAHDPEAIELARRAHAVFPEVPVLGVDVVRDAVSGSCYVLETNPTGPHWTLATPGVGLNTDASLDTYGQLGAIKVMAEASAEAVYRLAR